MPRVDATMKSLDGRFHCPFESLCLGASVAILLGGHEEVAVCSNYHEKIYTINAIFGNNPKNKRRRRYGTWLG
jgi:hypothetical protein